jgi:DNA-3-methyladenine glycosylase
VGDPILRAMPPPLEPPRGRERQHLRGLLTKPPALAARGLLGQILVAGRGRLALAVRIVETEAYLGQSDPAAHAFHGRTPRTDPLWGPPGTIYVYFVYGMHHCLNLAADRPGVPGCVLIRAAEPLLGTPLPRLSCRGPGRLCRTLGIDTRLSGSNLFASDAALTLRAGPPPVAVGVSPRVGVRLASEERLRFFDPRSPAVSSPRFGLRSGVGRRAVPGRPRGTPREGS